MATLQRIQSEFGFVFWGGNYLVSGVQEPDELRLVSRELSTADVLLDCGANAGLFTCLSAARGVPAIAIEPYPPNLAVLYRNIEENRFAVPVEVFPVALGERPGIASLFGRGQGASLVPGWGGLPSYDSNKVLELFWERGYRVADALTPNDPASIVTPERVAGWLGAGRSDLGGENLWLTPP